MGSRRLNLAANPSQQASKALSLFHNNKVSFITPTYTRGWRRRLLSAGSIPAKQQKRWTSVGIVKEREGWGRGIGRLIRPMTWRLQVRILPPPNQWNIVHRDRREGWSQPVYNVISWRWTLAWGRAPIRDIIGTVRLVPLKWQRVFEDSRMIKYYRVLRRFRKKVFLNRSRA